MTFDDGIVKVYEKINRAGKGELPKPVLSLKAWHYFSYGVLGYGRYYEAKRLDEQLEDVINIERNRQIHVDDIVILEDGTQCRISTVKHVKDEDGIEYTELALAHINEKFDIENQEIQ